MLDRIKLTAGAVSTTTAIERTLPWSVQEYISNPAMHSTGTNPERVYVSKGIWEVFWTVSFAYLNVAGVRKAILYQGPAGSNRIQSSTSGSTIANAPAVVAGFYDTILTSTGQYFYISVRQDTGSSLDLPAGWSNFMLHQLRADP